MEHDELFQEAFDNRVAYQNLGMLEEEQLVEFLTEREQVLCVVGTKDGARRIYRDLAQRAVGEGVLADESEAMAEGFFHLSAAMTPSHRSEVLSRIKERLRLGQRCMVVATQVVEAGVDVDFPVVYRELAGIDSLVQAAGRCNREGRGDTGVVRIFDYAIDGEIRREWAMARADEVVLSRMVIRENGGAVSAELVRPFFEYRYRDKECLDEKGIYASLADKSMLSSGFKTIPFEQVALDYRIIAEDTVPIISFPEETKKRLNWERLRSAANPSALAMRLQRYSVSIPKWRLQEYKNADALEQIEPFWVLREDRLRDFYREDVGLAKPGEEEYRPLFF